MLELALDTTYESSWPGHGPYIYIYIYSHASLNDSDTY